MRPGPTVGEERRAEAALRGWLGSLHDVSIHLEAVDPGERPAYRYTVAADAPATLARVVMAAIDHPALEVDFGLPPRATWPALGPRPRPVCRLRLELPPVRSAGRRWR
jgi:hypothetical protein